jgi:hypothetical protein
VGLKQGSGAGGSREDFAIQRGQDSRRQIRKNLARGDRRVEGASADRDVTVAVNVVGLTEQPTWLNGNAPNVAASEDAPVLFGQDVLKKCLICRA